jgi:integrase
MQAGREARFLPPLLKHFGDKPLDEINQAAIDGAAEALYPDAPGATRNRQVYSPISAVLRHAGVVIELKRPKGSRGQNRLHWFKPEDAGKFLNGAYEVSDRFGALCTFLLYTGCRLSEGLNLRPEDVWLQERYAYVRKTKNGEPRPVHLTPDALAALANLKWGKPRVFGMTKCGRIYTWFSEAEKHSGIAVPEGIAFHIFRHTYGAWMRRYGGLDTSALVETGAWKSRQSAAVYEHVDASEEAKKADALPMRLAKVTSASDLLAPIPT